MKDCENHGITVFMPIPSFNPTKSIGVPEPEFCSDKFVYDARREVYVCPGGAELELLRRSYRGKEQCWGGLYGTKLCMSCAFRGGALGIGVGGVDLGLSIRTLWTG